MRRAVAWAAAEETPLEVVGTGTRRAIGRPAQAAHTLDLSGVSGIVLYEPEELVLSARAGTPRAEIEAALAEAGQTLAFEPVDTGPLLGRAAGEGTIGGIFATGLSGPRRIAAGGVRDHMLGIAAVSGRGEAFKSGGRVVKNVTGYDLSRGLAGSWGTLAVATELTLKVLPRPETVATVVVAGLGDRDGVALLCRAMGSAAEVTGAAHLPADVARAIAPLGVAEAASAIRIEGFGPSVAARVRDVEALANAAAPGAPATVLEAEPSAALWGAVRDALPFVGGAEAAVWRVSVAPTAGPAVVAAVRETVEARAFYDWSGGLVWLRVPEAAAPDGGAGAIRAAVAAARGGHATLIRGSAELRTRIAPFEPPSAANAALSARLKAQFDPRGILNPGRMTAGL